MDERGYIEILRSIAIHPSARALGDDAALIEPAQLLDAPHGLVLTHDMIVEGVHFRAADPPDSVGWKLVMVNASDLAAKGASPWLALMGATLAPDAQWNRHFLEGVAAALARCGAALIGGDTVGRATGGGKAFGLTLIGAAGPVTPSRSGARPGDRLYVTGRIGRAGRGLAQLESGLADGNDPLAIQAYLRPQARLAEGVRLAPFVSSMMDISDGLLIDAARLAEASGVGIEIDLDRVPVDGSMDAAIVAGDDYELLLTVAGTVATTGSPVHELLAGLGAVHIGHCRAGRGLRLVRDGRDFALPRQLGWLHQG